MLGKLKGFERTKIIRVSKSNSNKQKQLLVQCVFLFGDGKEVVEL